MGISIWMPRILALGACGLASFCLWGATKGVQENPNDPTDVAGIPAFSMYVVILVSLFLVSFCSMTIGFIVETYLGSTSRSWRLLGYCFGVFSLYITSGLGLLVSSAYHYGALLGFSAFALYALSIVLLIFNSIRFGSSFSKRT